MLVEIAGTETGRAHDQIPYGIAVARTNNMNPLIILGIDTVGHDQYEQVCVVHLRHLNVLTLSNGRRDVLDSENGGYAAVPVTYHAIESLNTSLTDSPGCFEGNVGVQPLVYFSF